MPQATVEGTVQLSFVVIKVEDAAIEAAKARAQAFDVKLIVTES